MKRLKAYFTRIGLEGVLARLMVVVWLVSLVCLGMRV